MGPRKTTITVEVTEEDIKRAERNNSFHCVVSQAIARTVPDATSIDTDMQSIRFTVPVSMDGTCQRWIYWTPYSIQEYIVDFDAGEDIQPFKFKLQKPQRSLSKRNAKSTLVRKGRRASEDAYRKALKKALKDGVPEDEAKAQAREAYAVAREDFPAEPLGPTRGATDDELTTRRAPPRNKHRTYGGRLMRINKEALS